MRTFKVTPGPHYDTDATMVIMTLAQQWWYLNLLAYTY